MLVVRVTKCLITLSIVEFFELTMEVEMNQWLPILGIVPTTVIATVTVIVFLYNRQRDKLAADKDERSKRMQLFQIIEQNFDVLQRLNEAALQSGTHARAAMQSVNPDENLPEHDALVVFFHYHRLNRVFRIFEYKRHGFIEEEEFWRVFVAYRGTLLEALKIIDRLKKRGYPEDFIDFLKKNVKEEHRAPKIDDLFPLSRNV